MRLVVLAALAASFVAPGPAAAEPSLAEAEARLGAINTLARQHYAGAKQAALAASGPVIVVTAEELILWRGGEEARIAYLPARYRHLKMLGHVPLGLWSLLAPHVGRPAAELGPALATYRAHVAALEPVVGVLGLRWDDAKRQREILATTLGFIDKVAHNGVNAAALDSYADDVAPALLGNAYDAAEAQLAALHEIVQRWRAALSPAEWDRAYVVVLGPNRPREAQPPYFYFQRLLGREAALRLIVADNVTDSAAGLDLLAAAVNDRRLAASFFADSGRLEQGLLSDATRRHLDRLFSR